MKRTNVETEFRNRGNPSLLYLNVLFHQPNKLLSVKVRKRYSLRRSLQSESIALRSEESDFSLDVLVCLEPFEALQSIMQSRAERVESESFEWFNDGVIPSFIFVPLDRSNMITVVFSEEQDVGSHFW